MKESEQKPTLRELLALSEEIEKHPPPAPSAVNSDHTASCA
jgi:hypothetical protein